MKTNCAILLLAAQILNISASPSPAVLNEDCGPSGLMNTTNVPEGVDPSAVRKCSEHPLGRVDLTGRSVGLVERTCVHGNPGGCDNGYCWKSCGDGPWCWTARNGGFGDWYTCSKDSDCLTSYDCGQKSGGNCDKCGCSC
ncbi:uncharacterized protein F4822DRAFT_128425 [Hypoxylon trugodes]|uniref:uncharacterized protein n=1 Tax=Hypoxylon trugodes TaxID=326681 RepID=UPI00219858E7|nr:uncharacterized protein F4822DRAFT_128425 [Hypoxylon trugodes]KAI1392409.1 hypothetical protein F4822DRAFT_128425 [Hypoxylon trugodes]